MNQGNAIKAQVKEKLDAHEHFQTTSTAFMGLLDNLLVGMHRPVSMEDAKSRNKNIKKFHQRDIGFNLAVEQLRVRINDLKKALDKL